MKLDHWISSFAPTMIAPRPLAKSGIRGKGKGHRRATRVVAVHERGPTNNNAVWMIGFRSLPAKCEPLLAGSSGVGAAPGDDSVLISTARSTDGRPISAEAAVADTISGTTIAFALGMRFPRGGLCCRVMTLASSADLSPGCAAFSSFALSTTRLPIVPAASGAFTTFDGPADAAISAFTTSLGAILVARVARSEPVCPLQTCPQCNGSRHRNRSPLPGQNRGFPARASRRV